MSDGTDILGRMEPNALLNRKKNEVSNFSFYKAEDKQTFASLQKRTFATQKNGQSSLNAVKFDLNE